MVYFVILLSFVIFVAAAVGSSQSSWVCQALSRQRTMSEIASSV
jgi:hypothetical protein